MPFSVPEDGATSPQGSDALSAPSFEPFSRLPLELRRQIWLLALPATDGPGVCLMSPYRPLTVRNPYSSLMGTSREARETALEGRPLTRDYDPETDILYVRADNFYKFCDMCRGDDWPSRFGNMCRDSNWPSRIQHLALALPIADRGWWLPIAMNNLDRLQTISVVYPKATGEVDVHENVLLPNQPLDRLPGVMEVYGMATGKVDVHEDVLLQNQPYLRLRKFTEIEMDAFKINADYLFETHGGDRHIVWTKSAREHLDLVRAELTQCASTERPPCWDNETRSLRLTFEARCFEVVDEL